MRLFERMIDRVVVSDMFRRLMSWKFVLAFLTVTAFAAVTGHETLHPDHSKHCAVCHVKQVNPSDTKSPAASFFVTLILFFILVLIRQRLFDAKRHACSSRAPPIALS
jgi:hypothetical protein